ncbi:MAG TPA: hypothetical protein VL551_15240 [Actinospica sp.]|jgi:hypothetical protein|nr:hypothetical protein [Actinospica sp.]
MSSSGLIYAFIVGAWAVYLVPMWLRREDELNTARQTQRYTTAIKVLSHKDSFERRYGAADEQEQARELPLAAGQSGPAPAAGKGTLDRVRQKERERAAASASGPARRVTARVEAPTKAGATARGRKSAAAPAASSADRDSASNVWTPAPPSLPAPDASAARSVLRARRRKVVGFLFALTSLGALVSADLGLGYVWAMLLPAAVLSGYIAWCRKDERARAAERARRRAAAAKAAREAERRELEQRRQLEEAEQFEREELARRNAVARRRVAAARSRAERRTGTAPGRPDQGDLPRAANG